jgi:hypothetical protein
MKKNTTFAGRGAIYCNAVFCAVSVILLSQCDDWNKPLIERIKKSTDEQKTSNIQELVITRLPWPNTFNTGETEPVHYDNPDWPDGSWEEMGLEVCAVLKTGGWQKLTPDKYVITGFDSQTPGEKEIISVYAKDDPEKSAEFSIMILDNGTEYKSVSSYQGAGGKIIPYPSKAAVGSDSIVNLHIYADNGYALDGASIKIETAEGVNVAYKAEGGVYTFTMPDSDVTLSAKFINSEAKLESGGNATYYEHLKDAVEAAVVGGGGAITLLKTPVYIDDTITITGGNDITLNSDMWKEQEIHWGGPAGENVIGMIEVEHGASLTMDGTGGGLVIDGAEAAETARLVKVAGDLAMKDGVTLKNSKGGGVYIANGGTFTMDGGEISANTVELNGGGVDVSDGGKFIMNGGAISGNSATYGGGVCVNGEFSMSGAAFVAQDNAVYLGDGRQITITGILAPNLAALNLTAPNFDGGKSAKIEIYVPADNTVSRKILNRTDGGLTESDIAKFTFDTAVGEIKAAGGGGWLIPAGFEAFTSGASITAYKTLTAAVDGAATGNSVITLLKNTITLSSAVSIASGKNITLAVPNGETYTIKRAGNFTLTASLFAVESGASLTLGGSGGGLIIDGANVDTKMALISVSGVFAMKNGVTLKDGEKGGVEVTSGGAFTMSGGTISGNTTSLGGGVWVKDGGTFTMSGGEISGNTAVSGGGAHIDGIGTFTMSGGTISGNTAQAGGGVFVDGNFNMSGAAFIAQDNNVYLENNRQITVTGILAPPVESGGKSAKIAVSDTTNTARLVIKGFSAEDAGKFSTEDGEIVAAGLNGWFMPANNSASITTAGSITSYETLSAAVAGAALGDSVITLLKKTIELSAAVNITAGKNITLAVPNGETYTIKHVGNFTNAALFSVASGASLTLGGSGGELVVDGANVSSVNTALISVSGGFAMKNGVTLKGGKKGGVVVNSGGAFTMSGGEISGNNATYGGGVVVDVGGAFTMSGDSKVNGNTGTNGCGVYVKNGGAFTMNGGEISGNSGMNGGGVYVMSDNSVFKMSGGTISGNTTSLGGGVYINSGVFTMGGGVISGNTAEIEGGGVYVSIGGVFKMNDGTISGNNAVEASGGNGVYVGTPGGTFEHNGGELQPD